MWKGNYSATLNTEADLQSYGGLASITANKQLEKMVTI